MNRLAMFLKVKQVSLELETKYIKKQINKHSYDRNLAYSDGNTYQVINETNKAKIYNGLTRHLSRVVSVESRATNIARAYLRNKPYSFAENRIKTNRLEKSYRYPENIPVVYYRTKYDRDTWKRVVEIIRKYENNRAYLASFNRRSIEEVEREVFDWRNRHPQLFGETENADKMAS